MPAANYNFTIEKGTAFVISFEYKDNDNNIINHRTIYFNKELSEIIVPKIKMFLFLLNI